ncbi:prepro-carboxypeptidase Z [Zychaea mexicana]|uniref:prepro-carboxypeptidase Z n=1 Tax=Zychaea mexicana TaxID=64656 RepID=UPI0022FE52E2|nr:prepro-carboxypeptidase Z [Zychaea mexicana]KAI9496041.1 prepro-carboxypeptidase Z [Zychaea mexicana]
MRNPSSSIRLLQPTLCDPNVTQYSGYFDVKPDVHYFFWFFESVTEDAPLTFANFHFVMWLNGGPGCSSMGGVFTGPGPCRVTDDGRSMEAVYNPYSWHRYSNMLFLDQPAGTGFSYGNGTINRTEEGAPLLYETLQLFLEAFPQYSKLPFHLFGESYASRYVTEYARYIVERNTAALALDRKILLQTVGFGNPWIDPLYHYESDPQMTCDSTNPFTAPPETCKKMKEIFRHECMPLLNQCSIMDTIRDCSAADKSCQAIQDLFDSTGQSNTDVRIPAIQYTPPQTYARFLNLASTQKQIGATVRYTECSNDVRQSFSYSGDIARSSRLSVTFLLDHGIHLLVYVGDVDFLCNWYGNYALFNDLRWDGADKYRAESLVPWILNDREVGQIKSSGPLTFIRVYQAGHVVPYYQPLPSLAMFRAWITNTPLNPLPAIYAGSKES